MGGRVVGDRREVRKGVDVLLCQKKKVKQPSTLEERRQRGKETLVTTDACTQTLPVSLFPFILCC